VTAPHPLPGFVGLPLRTPTLPPARHTNCYIVGHHDALVVDPGSAYPAELRRLKEALWDLRGTGGNVTAVFLTHHHRDHVGGAGALAQHLGVPVAAHGETHERLALPAGVARVEVHQGQTFTTDPGHVVEAMWTPGHAPGHLCLFERRSRTLVAGDMITGIGTTVIDPPDGQMAVFLRSLRRLAALDPTTILPAHGPSLDEGQRRIESLIDHRLRREARVLAALRDGPRDLMTITRVAYAEIPARVWPLASRSGLAHLIKLQDEGRAQPIGDDRWAMVEESSP